jgi:hypothetical protein
MIATDSAVNPVRYEQGFLFFISFAFCGALVKGAYLKTHREADL